MDRAGVAKHLERLLQNSSKSFRAPISVQQAPFLRDAPAKGQLWAARVETPCPDEPHLKDALLQVVNTLGTKTDRYDDPSYAPVKSEWVGYRSCDPRSPEPQMSNTEKYENLMKETTRNLTLLYIHGGAGYLGSAASSRGITRQLAKATGGRCLAVNYRLAPQAPFPAAILDVLTVYMSLLYPPAGSLHTAVSASQIVLVGESHGGALALAVLQVLLSINRQHSVQSLTFHGATVARPIMIPAGVSVVSPEGVKVGCLPDYKGNLHLDILQGSSSPPIMPDFPACAVWPTNPPRGETYCETSMLSHPLVSLVLAEQWAKSPPLYIACGEERWRDSAQLIAQNAARQGVKVCFEEYEAMCHMFIVFYPKMRQASMCIQNWAKFCVDCVEGSTEEGACMVDVSTLERRRRDVRNLNRLSTKQTRDLIEKETSTTKPWTGKGEHIEKASL